jgi:hypothetical protein
MYIVRHVLQSRRHFYRKSSKFIRNLITPTHAHPVAEIALTRSFLTAFTDLIQNCFCRRLQLGISGILPVAHFSISAAQNKPLIFNLFSLSEDAEFAIYFAQL